MELDSHRLVDEWFRRYAACAAENVALTVKLSMAMERIAALEKRLKEEPQTKTEEPGIFGQIARERSGVSNPENGIRVGGNEPYPGRPDQ